MKKIYEFLKTKLILIVGLGFFAYVVFVAFSGNDSKIEAWVLAKYEVENRLKSPSSAKFPSMNDSKILEIGDEIIISSYVDAENSFGAKIRSEFSVTLYKNSNGDYITKSVYIE